MIAKAKKWAVAALSLVLAVMLACTLISVLPKRAKAEVTPSAVFVQESSSTGQDWQSSGFGKNGWVILGDVTEEPEDKENGGTVYSNLYTESGDYGKDAEFQITLQGWKKGNKANTWLSTVSEGKGIAADENLNVLIDQWAFTSGAWRNKEQYDGSPYIPGTQTKAGLRLDGRKTQVYDTSFAVSKTTDDALYFTVYLYTQPGTDTSEVPVDFYVFYADGTSSQLNLKANVDTGGGESNSDTIADVLPRYGEAPLLGKTTVQAGIKYVTFKLEGTGDFQILATKGTDGEGELISGTRMPYLGGFFLDNEEPTPNEPVTTKAQHVLTKGFASQVGGVEIGRDAAAETFPYGKNGYVVMSSTSGTVYSDLYTEDAAYTDGSISLNGWSNSGSEWFTTESGNYIAAADSLDVPIDKWMLSSVNWMARTDGNSETASLFIPGTETPTDARLQGWKNDLNDTSISINKTSPKALYLTVYMTVMNTSQVNDSAPIDFYVYNGAVGGKNETTENFLSHYTGTQLLGKTSITQGRAYVTFKLEGTGEFQIVATTGTVGGAAPFLTGFFLDYDLTALDSSLEPDVFYKVSYDAGTNGINNPLNVNSEVLAGTQVTPVAPIPNEGYRFEGWYTDSEFTPESKVTGAYEVTGNVTFYAKYEEIIYYAISYELNGGTNASENPEGKVEANTSVTLQAPSAAPAHKVFEGWYTKPDFDPSSKVTGAYMVTGDVTFYAYFVDATSYTITYVLDSGTNGAGNPDKYYEGEGVASLADATKEGYTFKGWFLDENFETQVFSIPVEMKENITLYAKFEKVPVLSDITYNLNEGTNSPSNPAKYTEGEAMKLAEPTRDGYVFDGWYTNAEFTGDPVTEISATQTGAVTLYAKWTEVTDEPGGEDDPGDDNPGGEDDPGDDNPGDDNPGGNDNPSGDDNPGGNTDGGNDDGGGLTAGAVAGICVAAGVVLAGGAVLTIVLVRKKRK